MGRNFPAMAVVQVTALVEDRAKVEIQAHALIEHLSALAMLMQHRSATFVDHVGIARPVNAAGEYVEGSRRTEKLAL